MGWGELIMNWAFYQFLFIIVFNAVVFVVDCSADLSEARTCFDYCFRATNENEDERRSMLKGKPLLVLACVEIKQ